MNHPLLLSLMDEYGFTYEVQPPGPPFDKRPIPMVGWRDDPVQQQLTADFNAALGNREMLDAVLEREASLRRPVPLREYVDRGRAVFIAPYEYSFNDLTLAIAQQIGSSHEDEEVEEPIVKMQSIVIGIDEGHIAPLNQFADLIIHLGGRFLEFIVNNHSYQPRYFRNTEA
jgi:hypothetical protein